MKLIGRTCARCRIITRSPSSPERSSVKLALNSDMRPEPPDLGRSEAAQGLVWTFLQLNPEHRMAAEEVNGVSRA